MASFNKVLLIGNLTRDPEMRVTPKGTAICQFGMAMNRKWKGESGEMQEEVTFVDCEAWGKTAELVSKFLTKGSQAHIEGRLKLDQWEDKTSGQKRSKLKVVCDSVVFLGGKGAAPEAGAQPERQAPAATPAPKPAPKEGIDDDVPF